MGLSALQNARAALEGRCSCRMVTLGALSTASPHSPRQLRGGKRVVSSASGSTGRGQERMLAVTAERYGASPLESLKAAELPCPHAGPGQLVVSVGACSLSPGDGRALLGEKCAFTGRPGSGPYIPAGDVAGTVVEVGPKVDSTFRVGDRVAATWAAWGQGGLAEFIVVRAAYAARIPDAVDLEQAACLANSAGHAVAMVQESGIAKLGGAPGATSPRVLVLGGTGGLGSALLALLKGGLITGVPAHVTATGTDTQLLTHLGADVALDYRTEDWATCGPYDAVFDCAEGVAAWRRGRGALRRGGTWVAAVASTWELLATKWFHLFGILLPPLGRVLASCLPWSPHRYVMHLDGPNGKTLAAVLVLAAAGKLTALVDSVHPLTVAGAVQAFDVLLSRRAKGKVLLVADKARLRRGDSLADLYGDATRLKEE